MSEVIIDNVYGGYCESMEDFRFIPQVLKSDNPELNDLFLDLSHHCGTYKYNYEFDGKFISITRGCYTPFGEKPKQINREWLDHDINKMPNWSYKKRIRNCIE